MPTTDTSAPTDTNEAEYLAAVQEGKAIVADVSGKQWALGDLALKVEKKYGEKRLEQFAEDINFPGAACTLSRCCVSQNRGPPPVFWLGPGAPRAPRSRQNSHRHRKPKHRQS